MKVTKVFLKKINHSKIFAKADVMFDGVMSVKGFTVFQNDDGFSVLPPATLGKGKDQDTGETVDKWWNNIWIPRDSDEGKALIAEIKEKVVLAIRQDQHGEKQANKVLKGAEEDLLGDDEPLF